MQLLLAIADNFSLEDAKSIKEIERTTNHDVKAVEYTASDHGRELLEYVLADLRPAR